MITEKKLHQIIKESISNVLNKSHNNTLLYHQLPFDKVTLQAILRQGLKPNDNGESNCIWLSKNKPFYTSNNNTITLTAKFNQNFIEKHNYVDEGEIVRVFDIINKNEFSIKECPFCINTDTQKPLLAIQNKDFLKNIIQKKNISSIAEYIINNEQLKEQNITIFVDIYQKYIEPNTIHLLQNKNNIKLDYIM